MSERNERKRRQRQITKEDVTRYMWDHVAPHVSPKRKFEAAALGEYVFQRIVGLTATPPDWLTPAQLQGLEWCLLVERDGIIAWMLEGAVGLEAEVQAWMDAGGAA